MSDHVSAVSIAAIVFYGTMLAFLPSLKMSRGRRYIILACANLVFITAAIYFTYPGQVRGDGTYDMSPGGGQMVAFGLFNTATILFIRKKPWPKADTADK